MDHCVFRCLVVFVLLHLTGAKLDVIQQDNVQCTRSAVDYNVTMSKGANAGKFYKMDQIDKIDDCIGHCCRAKKCDIAFMVNKACYLVECYSQDSCDIKQSHKPNIATMLSIVNKPSKINKGKVLPGAEPAIEENLAVEKLPGIQTSNPFVVNSDDDMTAVSAFGTGKYKRTKRSSDVIDLVVAVGCGTVAVCVGVAGVIMMTRRLIDNSKNSAS